MVNCLHLWLPDLPGSKGGIQMFSGHLLSAIQDSGKVRKMRVIVKNEAINIAVAPDPSVSFHSTACWPARLRTAGFVALTTQLAARDKPDLIWTVHANF